MQRSWAAGRLCDAILEASELGGLGARNWAVSLLETAETAAAASGASAAEVIASGIGEACRTAPNGAVAALRLRGLALDVAKHAGRSGDAAAAASARQLAEALAPVVGQMFGPSSLLLRRVTWEGSTGRTLEQVAAAETVHPTDKLWRFRQRFGPGRRCFVLVHPHAPDDPVAVLHVALTPRPAASMGEINGAGAGALLPRPMASAHAGTGVVGRAGGGRSRAEGRPAAAAAGPPPGAASAGSAEADGETAASAADSAADGRAGSAAAGDGALTANFWSVNLCSPGLAGMGTARWLIYAAVKALRAPAGEAPASGQYAATGAATGASPAEAGAPATFVTLSPVPGFAKWLRATAAAGAGGGGGGLGMTAEDVEALLAVSREAADRGADIAAGVPAGRAALADCSELAAALQRAGDAPGAGGAAEAEAVLMALLVRWQHAAARSSRDEAAHVSGFAGNATPGVGAGTGLTPRALAAVAGATTRACAHYLVRAGFAPAGTGEAQGRARRPLCPVSNFHSSNGARLWRVNWAANVTPKGLVESFGVMVNYLYEPERLEEFGVQFANAAERTQLPHRGPVESLLRGERA